MAEKANIAFNFGDNWRAFSEKSLDAERLEQAVVSLDELIGREKIKGGTFLDIGCGSGIFAIAASLIGAGKVIGIDISQESITTSMKNKVWFAPDKEIDFLHKSIFDKDMHELGPFDIVYSWGVLHHTGDMSRAIEIASGMVAPHAESLFVIAIYNKHWSSGIWKLIKRLYNSVPKFLQRGMIWTFFLVIAAAKFAVTRRNPFRKKKRGMSFYYDVVDWVGGYPYEYATTDRIVTLVEAQGFTCTKVVEAGVPTGCNEFVFRRAGTADKGDRTEQHETKV